MGKNKKPQEEENDNCIPKTKENVKLNECKRCGNKEEPITVLNVKCCPECYAPREWKK